MGGNRKKVMKKLTGPVKLVPSDQFNDYVCSDSMIAELEINYYYYYHLSLIPYFISFSHILFSLSFNSYHISLIPYSLFCISYPYPLFFILHPLSPIHYPLSPLPCPYPSFLIPHPLSRTIRDQLKCVLSSLMSILELLTQLRKG